LGIWAVGPAVARVTPDGYPAVHRHDDEPVAEKAHRAVTGLEETIDGYEFHYPNEISDENLDEVRAALGTHDIYCIASGLHLDPRFGRGGLVHPRASVRSEARRLVSEAAEFAGSLGANLVIWLGLEAYDYPFPTRYADSWQRLIAGVSEAAEICARHGVKLFLDHRNSEPEMRILLRNVGMCLHVIQQMRAEGIDNVQLNLDWQHLLMNGERLSEYAALLASEGLLGHQHANPGLGTFEGNEIVGTAAFMETLELALELRRWNYGSGGERIGFDLYAGAENQLAAVRRSVLQWRYIDSVAAKVDDAALRVAQQNNDAGQAYQIVHAALGQ
jgi:xylose isomerase